MAIDEIGAALSGLVAKYGEKHLDELVFSLGYAAGLIAIGASKGSSDQIGSVLETLMRGVEGGMKKAAESLGMEAPSVECVRTETKNEVH